MQLGGLAQAERAGPADSLAPSHLTGMNGPTST